jgi:alpha-tubulin suppressor-like RCC1 family protein
MLFPYNTAPSQAVTLVNSTATTLYTWGADVSGQLGDGSTVNKSNPIAISGFLTGRSFSQIATGLTHNVAVDTAGGLWTWGDNTYGQLGVGTTIGTGGTSPAVRQVTAINVSWTAVGTAGNASLAITTQGLLYGWGQNYQSGDGSGLNRSTPVQLFGNYQSTAGDSWKVVSTGLTHDLAIRNSDSSLWAWGTNNAGQLGDSTTVNRSTPVQIAPGSWTTVSAGATHSAAINLAGQLYVWGDNVSGQIGDITVIAKSSPVLITIPQPNQWSVVSTSLDTAGQAAFFGIRTSDKSLWAWGDNSQGQLGDGTTINKSSPVQIGTSSWTTVAASSSFTSAIDLTGRLFTWGVNAQGQLGSGTTINRSSPVQVTLGVTGSSWSILGGGAGGQSAAITTNGELWTWGNNASGQLGDNTVVSKSSPVKVGSSSWTIVSVGSNNVVALDILGRLYTWGDNGIGQLGDGTVVAKSNPTQLGSSSWSKVSSGISTVHGITTSGQLWSWGRNVSGEIGDNTSVSKSSPVLSIAGWNVSDVKGGAWFAAAILTNGTLFAWGTNGSGQLADNTGFSKSSPVQIGLRSWSSISCGISDAGGISNGTLFLWGSNGSGQLGDNTVVAKSSPVLFSGASTSNRSWSIVAAGESHTVALTTDNQLFAWGANAQGQLGDGTAVAKSSPVLISFSSWSAIAAGYNTLAITSQNQLYAWGFNTTGQLGDGTTIAKSSPVIVNSFITLDRSWTMVAIANDAIVAVRASDRSLWAWGLNSSGQLGTGDTLNRTFPTKIGTSSWNFVAAGLLSVLAIDAVGRLFTWGYNLDGELGLGDTINRFSPVQVGSSSWSAVTSGWFHSAGIDSSGRLFTWGDNTTGKLGDNTNASKSSPVQIGTSSWTKISAGYAATMGIRIDGALFTWGGVGGGSGYLGDGTTIPKSSPVQIGTSSWSIVSSGNSGGMAIDVTGRLFAWGGNASGQLGQNNITNTSSPVQIGLSSWSIASSSYLSIFAIDIAGRLFTWGNNAQAQLGLGDLVSRSSPVQVTLGVTGSSWSMIASGNASYMTAVDTSGKLWAWGANTNGQLGDGTNINRSSPVLTVAGGSSFTAISTSKTGSFSTAVDSTGRLLTWGNNASGQLGDGTAVSKSTPVQLSGSYSLSSWRSISSGRLLNFTLAIRESDRSLWSWGINTNGQLGDGTTINKSSPIQIGTSSWTIVSAGFSHSTAIDINGALWAWGDNISGDLGDGTAISKSSPVQVTLGVTGSSWTSVAAGNSFTTALTINGNLYVWGLNTNGQLGDSTTISKSSPVLQGFYQPPSWRIFSSGATTTAAIQAADSSLWTWGLNSSGQVGDGTAINKSAPVKIGNSSWTTVSVSQGSPSYGIGAIDAAGRLFTWGYNGTGQLGDGTTITKSSPVQIGSSSWSAVSAAGHMAAIDAAGRLFTWGANNFGALGLGDTISRSSPVQVTLGVSGLSWTAVMAGDLQGDTLGGKITTAITTTGQLWTWGLNSFGALGQGDVISRSSPVQVTLGVSGLSWTIASVSQWGGGAITTTGQLWLWGRGNILGPIGFNFSRSSPVQVNLNGSSWSAVSVGAHLLAITTKGELWSWGDGLVGESGTGSASDFSYPQKIGTSSWTAVGASYLDSGAIDSSGRLFTWGANTGGGGGGQLGDGTTINKSSPVLLSVGSPVLVSGTSRSWTAISAGGGNGNVGGITNTGQLWTWGTGNFGQLGDGTQTSKSSPVQVTVATEVGWRAISGAINTLQAGGSVFGIRDIDRSLWAWGLNNNGQLGTGDIISKSSPVQIGNYIAQSWAQVSYGATDQDSQSGIAFAIRSSDRSLWAWGYGSYGQFGDGTFTTKSSPVQIGTNSWSMISAGDFAVAGITVDGKLFTWGSIHNDQGSLGDNSGPWGRQSPVQLGSSSWSIVSSGAPNFTAAITIDGRLFTWGNNTGGEIGDGTTINRSSPVQVTLGVTGSSWNKVSAGISCIAAITTTGQLWTWGANNNGAIGDGTTLNKSSPVLIGTSSWTAVSVASHTLAIDITGRLFTWGVNAQGQLGSGTTINRSSPVQVGALSWTMLSAGGGISTAIQNTGALWSWGYNAGAGLGDGTTINKSTPVQIGSSSWTMVSTSNNLGIGGSTAIDINGNLFVWGNGYVGYGDGTTIAKSSPVQIGAVFFIKQSWKVVSAGQDYAYGIDTTGGLWSWGNNGVGGIAPGGLGDGTTITRSTAVKIGASSWTAVSATQGYNTGVAIDTVGRLFAWGGGVNGILGDGTTIAKSSPVQIGSSSWSVVAGGNGVLAIDITGRLFAWGVNGGGLGDGTTIYRSSPVQIGTSSWTAVSIYSNALAIDITGRLFAWGVNSSGQLGDGTTINKSSPVQIGTSLWSAVYVSYARSYAIDAAGRLFAWGLNSAGRIGDGTTVNKSSPVLINSAGSWKIVASSYGEGFAVSDSNQLWAWGANNNGAIGDGTTIAKSSPVLTLANNSVYMYLPQGNISWTAISAGDTMVGLNTAGKLYTWGQGQLGDNSSAVFKYYALQISTSSWSSVSAGYQHIAALRLDGSLFTWGTNTSGQLGDSTAVSKSSPVQIGTNNWTTISAGGSFSTGLLASNRSLYAWGNNTGGQLGQGDVISRSSPVLIPLYITGAGNLSWSVVSAGALHTQAITSAGQLYTWGSNTVGQLGDGSLLTRSYPVLISASSWSSVAAGQTHVLGITSTGILYGWGSNSTGQLGLGDTINRPVPTVTGFRLVQEASFTVVSSGFGNFAYAVGASTGYIYGWGSNSSGQLGSELPLTVIKPTTSTSINSIINL